MECDRVFMVLFSAPFPTGASTDAAVERHLQGCPDCQQFAEALRPLEGATHEALPTSQRRSLPRYRGESHPVAVVVTKSGRAHTDWRHPGNDSVGSPAPRGWRAEIDVWAPTTQVAAFSLAPRTATTGLRDLLSIAAMLSAVGLGCWGLGWLALLN